MTDELLHPSLTPASGLRFGEAALTDQQRLGVVLEACSLLSHLRLIGREPLPGWQGAGVSSKGRLIGVRTRTLAPESLPQARLREVLTLLFRCPPAPEVESSVLSTPIVGPGLGRKAARRLQDRWSQNVERISVDRALDEIFAAAPFLWRRRHAEARASMAVGRSGGACWMAGPGAIRRRFLDVAHRQEDLERLLGSDRCRDLWLRPQGQKAGGSERKRGVAAARSWMLLGAGREISGDHPGAERAYRHAFRHAEVDSHLLLQSQALAELVGVRLRREVPTGAAEAIVLWKALGLAEEPVPARCFLHRATSTTR